MQVNAPSKLKSYRERLTPKVSQEKLATKADITLATYRHAEGGKTIQYSTAHAILNALNAELKTCHKSAVSMDDLGLSLE